MVVVTPNRDEYHLCGIAAHVRTHVAMEGHLQGLQRERLLDSRGRRPLQGLSYSALFKISYATTEVAAAELHRLLSSSPS